MNYLAYYEVLEGSGFQSSTDLDKLKKEWCFSMRIFAVPDDFNIDKIEKPRYPKIKGFKLVYSNGQLIHEKD